MRFIILTLSVLVLACQSKKTTIANDINGTLITDPQDFSVQLVLHLDSLYSETMIELKKNEGMDEKEATEFIQCMIDHDLLPTPEISFFDKEEIRQRKEISYEDFKKYVPRIKK